MNHPATPHVSSDHHSGTQFLLRVPHGLRSKHRLFALFARVLRFPSYFGWNWDAFEECLNDLSWLPAQATVTIVHEDVPFAAGSRDRGTYREIISAISKSPTSIIRLEGCSLN